MLSTLMYRQSCERKGFASRTHCRILRPILSRLYTATSTNSDTVFWKRTTRSPSISITLPIHSATSSSHPFSWKKVSISAQIFITQLNTPVPISGTIFITKQNTDLPGYLCSTASRLVLRFTNLSSSVHRRIHRHSYGGKGLKLATHV